MNDAGGHIREFSGFEIPTQEVDYYIVLKKLNEIISRLLMWLALM